MHTMCVINVYDTQFVFFFIFTCTTHIFFFFKLKLYSPHKPLYTKISNGTTGSASDGDPGPYKEHESNSHAYDAHK